MKAVIQDIHIAVGATNLVVALYADDADPNAGAGPIVTFSLPVTSADTPETIAGRIKAQAAPYVHSSEVEQQFSSLKGATLPL